MNGANLGLVVNFVGSVFLGLSSQFGSAAGWGGKIVWKKASWRLANALGWALLATGFAIQIYVVCKAR